MNAIVITGLIHALANWVLGAGILDKVEGAFDAWANKEISTDEKLTGIREQLKAEGLILSEQAVHYAFSLLSIQISHGTKS